MSRPAPIAVLVFAAFLVSSSPGAAQTWPGQPPAMPASPVSPDDMPHQVISANPMGYLFDLVNAEYEVRASRFLTLGAGASRLGWGTDGFDRTRPYVNGDVFLRYYPGGEAFNGVAIGVKAGYTHVPRDGAFLGIGFDANHSVMLNEHVYMGSGVGVKRLLRSADGTFGVRYIPTLRLNLGVGF